MLRTVIIEDEEPCLINLLELLKNYNFIEIVAFASNVMDAVNKIDTLKPDLIFLDINIPGGDGFTVLEEIKHTPFVVFVTAFDQFALKAFERNSIDYILKPVDKERLEKTITKINNIFNIRKVDNKGNNNESNSNHIRKILENSKKISVKTGDGVYFIRLNEILYIKAEDKYSFINLVNKNSIITDKSLKNFESEFPENFIRIHRNIIINRDKIHAIEKDENRKLVVKLDNKETFDVSIRMKTKLKSIAEIN